MPLKLSEKEILKRLQQLRNYERLYPELKKKYEKAKKRIKELETALAKERLERKESIEILTLQIEELQTMVFGKRKKKNDDDHTLPSGGEKNERKKSKERSSDSYRRSVPPEEEITKEKHYGIDVCPDCNEPLCNLRETLRYMEDILTGLSLKIVEKQMIETGFCKQCRKWHSSIPIQKQVCSLGENVRQKIVYAITVLGLTFEKVQSDLRDTFGIEVSDGEISNILTTEAAKLLPEYHNIDSNIRGSPAKHLDETGWSVQKGGEGNWGWVKTASDTVDTIFRLGRSRGKGNAQMLCRENGQPTVTDDYGAYDFLQEDQALCWAHPKRKFRDLAFSTSLSDERREHCAKFYKRFCSVTKEVKKIIDSPYNRQERESKANILRLKIKELCTVDTVDPAKLATLKATFLERTEAYLLCVCLPDIPFTNNKAERSIRPLVIKRKLSFGSKTQKGADVMSILMSVCFTTWWKCKESKKNFFEEYQGIIHKWHTT